MATRGSFLLILVPLALAACGGGGTKTTTVSVAPIDAAVTNTLAQAGEKVALSGNVDLSGQAVSISGSGAFSHTAGKLDLKLTLPLVGNSSLELLVKGTNAWAESSLLAGSLHGKQWLGIDLGKPAKVFGLDLTPLLIGVSPASLLRALDQGSNPVKLGTDNVGGTSTTHYRVDVSTTNVKGLQRTEDAWVDGQNLIRKLSYTVPIANGTKITPAVLAMTLSDFGTTVTVTPPPASEVAPISEVAK